MSNFHSAYNTTPQFVHHTRTSALLSLSSTYSNYRDRSISSSPRSLSPKFNFDLYNSDDYSSRSIDHLSPSSSVIIHHHPVHCPSSIQAISKLREINNELSHTLAHCELNEQLPLSPVHYHIHHHPLSYETYRSPSPIQRKLSSSSLSSDSESIRRPHNARITYKAHIPRRPNSLSKADQLLISTSDAYSHNEPMIIDLYPTREKSFVRRIRNRPNNQSPWPTRRNSFSQTSTCRTPRGPNYYSDKPLQPNSRLIADRERPRSSSVKTRIRLNSTPSPLRRSATSFSNTAAPVWRPSGSIKRPKFIGSNAPPSKPPILHEPSWNPASTKIKSKPIHAFDSTVKSSIKVHEPSWNPAGTKIKSKPIHAFDPTVKSSIKVHEPSWNPAGTKIKSKPIHAFDPTIKPSTKVQAPTWRPSSKAISSTTLKYFEPSLKPELLTSTKKDVKPSLQRKQVKKQKRTTSADPKLKARIAKAESKVKSAWETTTNVKSSIPRSIDQTSKSLPLKSKVKSRSSPPIVSTQKVEPMTAIDTGRSTLNNVSEKPMFQSTPKDQSINNDVNGNVIDLFDHESEISAELQEQSIVHALSQEEKTAINRSNISVEKSDHELKSTSKDHVLKDENDADMDNIRRSLPMPEIRNDEHEQQEFDNQILQESPIPSKHDASLSKANNGENVSIVEDEQIPLHNESYHDDTNEDVESMPEMDNLPDTEAKAILDNSRKDDILSSSTSQKADIKTSPYKEISLRSPPPENSDQNSYHSPIHSKTSDQKIPSTRSPLPPTQPVAADDIDDFFD